MLNRRRVGLLAVGLTGIACRSTPRTAAPAPVASATDPSIQADNDRFVQQIAARIAGRQNEPAEKVFKNLTILPTVPAGTLLSIMNGGYAKALGVRCTYCHVETDFSSDDKRPKKAAREMALMHRMINQELRKMQYIQTPATENRAINCMTCHRGAIDPLGRR